MGTIILQDGTILKGKSFGAFGGCIGEVVFNTATTGYQEILTDPAYAKQIIVMAYPEIGNCGINNNDFESDNPQVAGLIVKNYCTTESHYKSTQTLNEYLTKKDIIAIEGVDTRSLVQKIREQGSMSAYLSSDDLSRDTIDAKLKELQDFMIDKNIVMQVTCKTRYMLNHSGKISIAYIDYGTKKDTIDALIERDCRVTVFPADVEASEILENDFDAVFLSSGPGDPANCEFEISQLKVLLGRLPIFAIGLGCQLLALALGAETYKLDYGHRGANQPVINLENNKILITNQNHGYAVDEDSLTKIIRPTYKNLNDDTLEGFEVSELQVFALQFYPQNDSLVFDEWINIMNKNIKKANGATNER